MHAYELGRKLAALSDRARAALSGIEINQADARHLQLVLKQQIASLYHQMATVLLKESPRVGEMANVQKLLNKLQQEIAQSQHALQLSEKEIENRHAQLQQLHEEINRQEDVRDRQLEQNIDAVAARQLMVKSSQDVSQHENSHKELMAETTTKLGEYHQQRIFMFLERKSYGQPGYSAWPLSRNLDSWLARISHYPNNAANYRMLLSLQKESTRRLLELQNQTKQQTNEYQQYVQDVEKNLQLPTLYLNLNALEKILSSTQQEIRNQQNKLQEYAQGEGETYSQITTQLSAQMALLPLDKLDILVAKTETPTDDRLLEELRELQLEEKSVEENLLQQEIEAQLAQRRATAAIELNNQFSTQGYDNPIYEYQWGWSDKPEELFENYLSGAISLKAVLHKLDMITHRLPPPSATARASSGSWGNSSARSYSSGVGYSSSSSSSSSSSGSGGGFSSSSSTGGGGFRTTDSF
ncbi:MAG: hypothetical protein ACTH8H_11235 [Serratia proteamaculans]|jgi:hypothetical protein|uniref:hypothetical protein n=1 Tax=Serratia TaxID=613 RepID=UPI000BFFDFD4|nr:hypothetical protein [Serratia sp. BW106]